MALRIIDDYVSRKIAQDTKCPMGGVLFYTQNPMLEHWEACERHGLTMSWDRRKKMPNGTTSIVKVFCWYDSARAYFDNFIKIEEGHRHGYELMPEGMRCCPFWDIEFYDDVIDTAYAKFKMVCTEIRKSIMEVYGIEARILAYESSRWDNDKGQYKHSYHANVTNIVVENNECAEMIQLVNFAQLELHDLEGQMTSPFYYKEKGKKDGNGNDIYKHMVDMSVYTKNRAMRMFWCSKYGSKVVFERMRDPAMFGGYIDCTPAADAHEEFLWSIISRVGDEVTPLLAPVASIAAAKKRRDSTKKKTAYPERVVNSDETPFSKELLTMRVRAGGDDVSTISKVTMKGENVFEVVISARY